MELLPGLLGALDGLMSMAAVPEGLSPQESREWMHERIAAVFTSNQADRPPVASERDLPVSVDGTELTARVYRPDADAPLPCYLYFHGGGFTLGNLEQGDSTCRGIATDAECVVVNFDYRLAPEHQWPVAAEDCYAALEWVVEHADELGIDPARIAVGGASVGGNLAAVVALMARDRHGPDPVFQVLEIGVFDLDSKVYGLGVYVADVEAARNPYASPLLAPDLAGLPPALVMSAEFDDLAAEDAAYAERLRQAGVAVEERCWPGQFHGSQSLAKLIPEEAAEYHEQVVAALRGAFRLT